MQRLAMLGATLLTAAAMSFGQDATSVIRGKINDPTGASIPGAIALLRDAAGTSKCVISGKDGSFEFRNLPTGTYTLTASALGFATRGYDAVVVRAGRPTVQDVQLNVDVGSPAVVESADWLSVLKSLPVEISVCFGFPGILSATNGPACPKVWTYPRGRPLPATDCCAQQTGK